MKTSRQNEWAEAQRRCRLTDEALAMAKELGLSPQSLTKNIPNRAEPWKAPVEDWVRRLHLKKFGVRPTRPAPLHTAAEAPRPAMSWGVPAPVRWLMSM